jgi:hypothetical protein
VAVVDVGKLLLFTPRDGSHGFVLLSVATGRSGEGQEAMLCGARHCREVGCV